MDGNSCLPIQNHLIYSQSKVQSLSLPEYFFINYKNIHLQHRSRACVDIWLHMEIKWFLFNDSNRVQHNKLFLQQLQVNFINWSFSFLGKINILSITNPAITCWKTVSTMKQIFCQTKDQTHVYFMIMHTNCNWFLSYND